MTFFSNTTLRAQHLTSRNTFMMLRTCLFIVVYLYAFRTASGDSTLEQQPDVGLAKVFQKIYLERKFYTLVVFGAIDAQQSCVNDHTLSTLNISTTAVLLNKMRTCYLKGFNREVLIVSCVREPFREVMLETMLNCLADLRRARIVFYWQLPYGRDSKHPTELHKLFAYCERNFLAKVITVFSNITKDQRFFTYNKFPTLTLETRSLKEPCFPNRVLNMQGAPIRTMPDQNEPRSIVYYDKADQVQIRGYMVKFFNEFVEKHNATLFYPLPLVPEVLLGYQALGEMISNGTLDVMLGIFGSKFRLGSNEQTTTVLQTTWMPMIPYESSLPVRQILPLLFHSTFGLNALLLLLLLSVLLTLETFLRRQRGLANMLQLFLDVVSTTVLRSLLGQTAHLRPTRTWAKCLIYLLLFFAGMLITTVTTVYLQAYFASPPKPVKINSFKDLLASPIRLRTSRAEYMAILQYTGQRFGDAYKDVFDITPSIDEFNKQRKTLDIRYGYTITSFLWDVVAKHQERLPRPLFYVSDQIYFTKGLPMSIPIAQHSIYCGAFNTLIGQLQSAGLIEYWVQQGYDDMVVAGRLHKQRIYGKDETHALNLKDFYWIWWIYGAGMLLSAVVALLESFYYEKIVKRHQK